ncbi:MAG: hypothetical protein WC796_05395 [Candidatus Pacearchaeota archaeon]|jgi:hypothetical protein
MKKPTVYLEYLAIIILWFLILGKNILSSMVFLDYTYPTFFDLGKNLLLSNYNYNFYLLDLVKLPLSLLGLTQILVSLSFLICMLVSYFYIKRISKSQDLDSIFSLLFALIFFFNPFVYSRIMTGQIGVLFSYLLMPVFIFYLFSLFENNLNKKSIIKLVLAFTIASSFSLQFFVFNFIIFLFASFWLYFYKPDKPEKKPKLKKYFSVFGILIILTILLNLFWLQAMVFSNSSIFSSIDSSHEEFFSPKLSQGFPAIAKIIGMSGFWREVGYKTTFNSLPSVIWYTITFTLLILMLGGYYSNHEKKHAKIFYSLWWVGVIFATGISHPYTAPLFDFLFKNLPFFNGFRDSHKFVALIALSYAYLCPLGLVKLTQKLKSNKEKILKYTLVIIFAVFILFYSFPLIFLSNQIQPVSYPSEYAQLNSYLEKQDITGYVVYLPWQNYLTYNWTTKASSDGRITNPINSIVKEPVIVGSDRWGSTDLFRKQITQCLTNQDTKCLENLKIEYVIKDRCALYFDSYSWLNSSPEFSEGCVELHKLDYSGSKVTYPTPKLFIISLLISLITLLGMVYLLAGKQHKKQVQQQIDKH